MQVRIVDLNDGCGNARAALIGTVERSFVGTVRHLRDVKHNAQRGFVYLEISEPMAMDLVIGLLTVVSFLSGLGSRCVALEGQRKFLTGLRPGANQFVG